MSKKDDLSWSKSYFTNVSGLTAFINSLSPNQLKWAKITSYAAYEAPFFFIFYPEDPNYMIEVL